MLTQEEKSIVKSTVPVLRENGVMLTSYFYKRMFSHHPELLNLFNAGNQKQGVQQTALAQTVLAYAENIDNPEVLKPVIERIGNKHTSLSIQPEQYAIVGEHLIASISEVLQLTIDNPLIISWRKAYNQLAEIFINVEKSIYQEDASLGGWQGWKVFMVEKIEHESAEVSSFYLKPEDGSVLPSFKPGQYISIKVYLPDIGIFQPRQYSLTNAPNSNYYRISVKKEPGKAGGEKGLVSNHLHDSLKAGDKVEVSMPKGEFTLEAEIESPIVFISGGIGQTPFISMLESLARQHSKRSVIWIHGCRSKEVHAFGKNVKELLNAFRNSLNFTFYENCQEGEEENNLKGYIDLNICRDEILIDNADYYICGPSVFIVKQYEYLKASGIPAKKIHVEEFGPAILNLN